MNIEQVKQRIDLLDHFDYSLALFESNYKELMSVIDYMCDEKVGLELFAIVNRWKLYECQKHLGFKLHNYICAAKSLVDHSRVLYRRVYEKQSIKFDDYESEVKARFDNNSLSKFVEFLRTYAQHEKLPAISSGFSFDSQSDEGFIFTVSLDSSELLKSSSIKSLAKKYIREQDDGIDIKLVLSTYHKQVCDFYDWVKERQNEIHYEDLRALNKEYVKERKLAIERFVSSFSPLGHRGSVKELLYDVLSIDDYKHLEQFNENESMWLEQALSIIELEVNGVIPFKIKENLREQCAVEDRI
ncbi:hypothetical protein [Shewanella sp.]|uniref:hypothetical protein n=1 Tax=Shewanella sp. TaxID=50422 RepID=UPI001ED09889|nr:hypothetical protein [Shewanella sp.]NRB22832.1 hypothetical protein [Shewanella sp.]